MNIIKLALKAGWDDKEDHINIEAFAELVRADEREACANVCEQQLSTHGWAQACIAASAIRARKTK
jgi:hypothetical protein